MYPRIRPKDEPWHDPWSFSGRKAAATRHQQSKRQKGTSILWCILFSFDDKNGNAMAIKNTSIKNTFLDCKALMARWSFSGNIFIIASIIKKFNWVLDAMYTKLSIESRVYRITHLHVFHQSMSPYRREADYEVKGRGKDKWTVPNWDRRTTDTRKEMFAEATQCPYLRI